MIIIRLESRKPSSMGRSGAAADGWRVAGPKPSASDEDNNKHTLAGAGIGRDRCYIVLWSRALPEPCPRKHLLPVIPEG